MKIATFAKRFDEDEDGMLDILKEHGFLKSNGVPKAKYVDEYFDEDGNIIDAKGLQEELNEILGNDEDDDDEEEENEDDDDSSLDFDSLKKSLEEFEFESKEEIAELTKILVDKLADFDEEDDDSDDKDDEDEDEDDEEEDENPNEPGKYRGWTITVKGIKVTAKKGRRELNTSVRGNIRALIDDEED